MNNILDIKNATVADFKSAIDKFGWVLYDRVLTSQFCDQINEELQADYEIRKQIQLRNGIASDMSGTLHHLVERDNFAIKLLGELYLDAEVKEFLGGNYILNSFGGVLNFKDAKAYVQNVHRDVRSFTGGLKLMVNVLIFLDDFTLENGATHVLTGSHKREEKPTDDYFYANADRAVGKQGSMMIFDSHMWHATGKNQTDKMRRGLTLTFTRPYFKQQLDYPRYLGYDLAETLPAGLKQVLGYNARVPANLEEYYQPVEKRMYKRDQG